jgi:hypothetical protein
VTGSGPIVQAGELLLLGEQRAAGLEPFLARHHGVVLDGHVHLPSMVVAAGRRGLEDAAYFRDNEKIVNASSGARRRPMSFLRGLSLLPRLRSVPAWTVTLVPFETWRVSHFQARADAAVRRSRGGA